MNTLRRWPGVLAIGLAMGAGLLVLNLLVADDEPPIPLALTTARTCSDHRSSVAAIDAHASGPIAALRSLSEPVVAPAVSFFGPDDQQVTLEKFRGQYVLLNLWATWCPPCRAEMPALDRLQGHAAGTDVRVLALNLDASDKDKGKAFFAQVGIRHLGYYADPELGMFRWFRERALVVGLPTTLLIDPAGCIVALMAGPAEWDAPEALALVTALDDRPVPP